MLAEGSFHRCYKLHLAKKAEDHLLGGFFKRAGRAVTLAPEDKILVPGDDSGVTWKDAQYTNGGLLTFRSAAPLAHEIGCLDKGRKIALVRWVHPQVIRDGLEVTAYETLLEEALTHRANLSPLNELDLISGVAVDENSDKSLQDWLHADLDLSSLEVKVKMLDGDALELEPSSGPPSRRLIVAFSLQEILFALCEKPAAYDKRSPYLVREWQPVHAGRQLLLQATAGRMLRQALSEKKA